MTSVFQDNDVICNSVMPEGEKNGGGAVVIGGDNLPSPDWNRVN